MSPEPSPDVLDVRELPKPRKHPTIFGRYEDLRVGDSFVLVNDHNPIHLREEFEAGLAGSYEWEYLSRERRDWRIRITKLAGTPLPRVLVNTGELPSEAPAGAVWSIAEPTRDLDSNVIWLPPGDAIAAHAGPDLDVLVHVLSGKGTLTTELGEVGLSTGAIVFLPRRSLRGFSAGDEGLRYLTVHQRRRSLTLQVG